jgi:hypothetical protein
MGMIKTKTDLQKQIQSLNELLEQIDNHYSLGPARELEKDLEITQNRFLDQKKAKRYLAYMTWQRLSELHHKREFLNKGDLQLLRDSIREIQSIDRDIKALRSKHRKENKQSKEYPWVDTALEIWEGKSLDNKKIPQKFIGVSGLAGIGIGIALMVLENLVAVPELSWIGGILSGIGLGLSLYFGIKIISWSNQVDESLERKSIRDNYENKFNEPLRGLADLRTRKAQLQKIYISAQTTQSLLQEKQNQRKLKKQYIENRFSSFSSIPESEESWQKALEELEKESEILDNEILETKLQFSKLDINEDDFTEESPGVDFSPGIMKELERDIEELESSLADLQMDLDNLKARACERTGDDIRNPWQDVLYNLQLIQADMVQKHKDLAADLIAKIGLAEVLTRLREDEDRKINQAINTEPVSSILNKITGRYQRLDLGDDQVFVHDAYSKFKLSDLSTGAREQVLLALRLGIASQICEGNPLFLILDDAFQHSDWNRRESLVLSTLELAQAGWQIIYLSMDDHIRDLFINKIKPVLKKDFKLIQLDKSS